MSDTFYQARKAKRPATQAIYVWISIVICFAKILASIHDAKCWKSGQPRIYVGLAYTAVAIHSRENRQVHFVRTENSRVCLQNLFAICKQSRPYFHDTEMKVKYMRPTFRYYSTLLYEFYITKWSELNAVPFFNINKLLGACVLQLLKTCCAIR